MAAACRRPRVVEGWFSLLERRCLACTVFFFFLSVYTVAAYFPFFFSFGFRLSGSLTAKKKKNLPEVFF